MTVIIEDFERRAGPVAEDVERPAERMLFQGTTAHGGQAIEAFAEIDGLDGE
ncbi:MAG TPA: hypothetical protein VIH59_26795 [Candidatus Tectomicrobia bacterium]